MNELQRGLLELLAESPLTEATSLPAPVSCKGKDWRGRPLLWNDREEKCVALSGGLHDNLQKAQKATASAIGHSRHAQAFGEKHKDAAEAHEEAASKHKKAAELGRKEGFYHLSASLARQTQHHEKMKALHTGEHEKPKQSTTTQAQTPAVGAAKEVSSTTKSKLQLKRDHRGRFSR